LVVNDASKGADTVTAGGLNQTLTGGAGKDTFVGFSGGSTTFADLAAAINGDVINNFRAPGDTIDFTDVSFASLSFNFAENSGGTAGVMTVSDGTHTAAVTLGGSFSPGSFHQTALGSGTIITYS
jgi:Ca2+-binding RTX toxin-like protein